jgi:mono/diheme cytochrome c family protein
LGKVHIAIFFVIGTLVTMSGCVNHMGDYYNGSDQAYRWHEPGYRYPEQYDPSVAANEISDFESNGEMIYYTGFNESGQQIPFRGGPHWLYVHGGSCVSCHGTDGEGGVPIMMSTVIPPNITYETLTSEQHETGEDEGHPPYTDETIKIAIRQGEDPSGEELDYTMPRWDMSDEDVNDLIEYLKTL